MLALFLQNKAKQSMKNIMAGRPLGRSCCLLGLGGASLAVPGGHGRVERACSRPAPTPAGGTCPPPPHVAYPGEKRVAPSSSIFPRKAPILARFFWGRGGPAQASTRFSGLLGSCSLQSPIRLRSSRCCVLDQELAKELFSGLVV